MDEVLRAYAREGQLRIFCTRTTQMVMDAQKTHNLSPAATIALGKVLTIGVMLGVTLKNPDDRLSILIKGDGPIGNIATTFTNQGVAKGYVNNPEVDSPLVNGSTAGEVVGKNGVMAVTYDMGLAQPYIGYSSLVNGQIDDDFAYYFSTSEQQPSVVRANIELDENNNVVSAGGVIIQAMPGTPDDLIAELDTRFSNIDNLITSAESADAMLDSILGDREITVRETLEPKYICDCSRERLEMVLVSLGKEELYSILDTEGVVEANCHFCNKTYEFNREDVDDIYTATEH